MHIYILWSFISSKMYMYIISVTSRIGESTCKLVYKVQLFVCLAQAVDAMVSEKVLYETISHEGMII